MRRIIYGSDANCKKCTTTIKRNIQHECYALLRPNTKRLLLSWTSLGDSHFRTPSPLYRRARPIRPRASNTPYGVPRANSGPICGMKRERPEMLRPGPYCRPARFKNRLSCRKLGVWHPLLSWRISDRFSDRLKGIYAPHSTLQLQSNRSSASGNVTVFPSTAGHSPWVNTSKATTRIHPQPRCCVSPQSATS